MLSVYLSMLDTPADKGFIEKLYNECEQDLFFCGVSDFKEQFRRRGRCT